MKIQGQNKEMLANACQMFMGKSEAEIAQIALETLEGHQRAIIAHLTVEVGLSTVTNVFAQLFLHNSSCSLSCWLWTELWLLLTLLCEQEIYQDRKKFSEQVFRVASSDLINMGIGVVSYTLKDVHDDQVCLFC